MTLSPAPTGSSSRSSTLMRTSRPTWMWSRPRGSAPPLRRSPLMTVDTNESSLVQISVSGQIAAPEMPPLPGMPHVIGRDGRPVIVPPSGGIVLNVKVGDPAFGWVAEQVNPRRQHPPPGERAEHRARHVLLPGEQRPGHDRCGPRRDRRGHRQEWTLGRARHPPLRAGRPGRAGDRRPYPGQGVRRRPEDSRSCRGSACKSMAPSLLSALECSIVGGKLEVPVVAKVPPELLGAGTGAEQRGLVAGHPVRRRSCWRPTASTSSGSATWSRWSTRTARSGTGTARAA